MLKSLTRNGMLIETLFLVEGDLVKNYNRALETVIGKRTHQTSFHIDKRGESPELEKEFGKNYLQSGPAHRYCIIVSPDQKDAVLIHEEFSFDHEMLDLLYQNYLPGISLATRVDGMYGEIDDGVREFETFEDLLLAKRIHLELHTPSKFLVKARELHQSVEQLKEQPDLLIEDNSALPQKILQLVGEVGDIRGYNLRPIQATKPLETFYTRLFGGVCVFRNAESRETLQITRPGHEHFVYDVSGDPLLTVDEGEEPLLDFHQTSQPSKTVVIYQQKDYQPEDGPLVQFIPLQDKDRIIQFLIEYRYADYSYELLESRLSRIEDETLLSKGHDVTGMDKEQRLQSLHQYRETMLSEWYELKELKRNVNKGHTFQDIIKESSVSVQSMLLASIAHEQSTSEVVKHLLTRLYDYNYESMFHHNRRHLERVYLNSDDNKQKYILHVLAEHSHHHE